MDGVVWMEWYRWSGVDGVGGGLKRRRWIGRVPGI